MRDADLRGMPMATRLPSPDPRRRHWGAPDVHIRERAQARVAAACRR
ncbi:MAG: hypothetical protein ICV73_06805 [Acetobacteraceae bacterium]|nr:hypothetical protein [Acetobacteraceae bacterium]